MEWMGTTVLTRVGVGARLRARVVLNDSVGMGGGVSVIIVGGGGDVE